MSIASCAALVEKGDPDRFLSVMAAPQAARAPLMAIYAFNVEVARAPWVTQEAMIAEMRLQWWRDALEELAQSKKARAHEVVEPLAEFIDPEAAGILDRLVAARRWDIYRDPFEDQAHLEDYLQATSGGLMWVAARALGLRQQETAVRDIGYAMGVANWLRAVPALEAQGRIPLVDGRPQAIAQMADKALARLNARVSDARAYPALRAAWQTGPILRLARRQPERAAQGRLALSEFSRKGRLVAKSLLGRY